MSSRYLLAVAIASLFTIFGCGSPHDANVHGTVTLDGAPLTNGEVQFHPLGTGGTAYGRLGEGGSYVLGTGTEQGLDPGDYKVTVVATEPVKAPPTGGAPAIPKLLSPTKYGSLDTTTLKYTVTAGDNTIDLPLTAK